MWFYCLTIIENVWTFSFHGQLRPWPARIGFCRSTQLAQIRELPCVFSFALAVYTMLALAGRLLCVHFALESWWGDWGNSVLDVFCYSWCAREICPLCLQFEFGCSWRKISFCVSELRSVILLFFSTRWRNFIPLLLKLSSVWPWFSRFIRPITWENYGLRTILSTNFRSGSCRPSSPTLSVILPKTQRLSWQR